MPLTPASKKKILLIIAKNAKRGGRGAVIKYVKRASKGKPGRPPKGPDIRLAEEVQRRIAGRPRYIRKACMLLAEEMKTRGEGGDLTIEQLADKLRRNHRLAVRLLAENILG